MASLDSAIRDSADGCELTVLAKPRARRTEYAGTHDGALCVRVQAPPVDGKANEELIAFLARKLDVPKSTILVRRGVGSRRKVLLLKGMESAGVSRRLNALQTGA
jgi:hypothetical protein